MLPTKTKKKPNGLKILREIIKTITERPIKTIAKVIFINPDQNTWVVSGSINPSKKNGNIKAIIPILRRMSIMRNRVF